MPTNEKSECCNAKILSCDCMPKDGACFRRCSKCDVDLPTPDKLAEAKKLLEIWNIEKSDTMGGYVYINPIHVAHTDALLAAQSLISYERGREEQRKETIKRVKSVKRGNWENTPEKYKWPMDAPYYSCYIRGFNAAKFRINQTINPSPDAK